MDAGQLFNVDPLESRAARGHGVVTSMACGNDVILLGTSKGWIIRHDFALGDSQSAPLFPFLHSFHFPYFFFAFSFHNSTSASQF
jgi:hypothetical protein